MPMENRFLWMVCWRQATAARARPTAGQALSRRGMKPNHRRSACAQGQLTAKQVPVAIVHPTARVPVQHTVSKLEAVQTPMVPDG